MEPPRSRAAVFLDRDGTLIEEKCYLTRPEQVRVLPGVGAALARLRTAGFVCVVVTNQSAIGRGMMTEADLEHVHVEMLRQLRAAGGELDAIYHCPVAPPDEHPERKPAPGMLLRAAADMQIDLGRSWMIGDQLRDALAGRSAGCRGCFLVRTGHPAEGLDFPMVDDLGVAVAAILAAHEASADSAA